MAELSFPFSIGFVTPEHEPGVIPRTQGWAGWRGRQQTLEKVAGASPVGIGDCSLVQGEVYSSGEQNEAVWGGQSTRTS